MFFLTKDTIPSGVGFKTFGATHLIWLGVIAVVTIVATIFYRGLNAKNRKIMLNILGILIVANEIAKDTVDLLLDNLTFGNLPLHLCGINILLIGFDLIKQTKTVRNFLYYFCIPGALLALLFPNWTVLPCMNFSHIHSFVIHGLLLMYPMLLVTSGEVSPDIKSMPKCIFLLVCMAIPIYFVNLLCDTNFMFLMEPETGNPLGLFEKYLGSHLWGFPILLPVVMFVMYLPLLIASKCKSKKREVAVENEQKPEVTV